MSVLVVGAGELGTATLEALVKHPQRNNTKIAVLLRQEAIDSTAESKKASVAHLRSLGVVLEAGDFQNDPSGLITTFKGYDTIIQCAGYGMAPGTQLGVTRAALAAGVRRYLPWQYGADYEAIGRGSSQPLFDEMLDVRALLRAQTATSWTIVSTGLFMSYLFLPDFGVVDLARNTVRALGSWDTAVTVTMPADIGTMVAEVVLVPDGTTDQVVHVGGDTITYGRLADVLNEVLGRELKRELWDMEFLKEKTRNSPDDLWAKYQVIFGEGRGTSWPFDGTLNAQRGIQLTTARDYVLENKESLDK